MTNFDFWNYIKKLPTKNLYSDRLVKAGLGQTVGGYFDIAKENREEINPQQAKPSQHYHFEEYYIRTSRRDLLPSYSRLHCPQLLMFIAEVAGLNESLLSKALKFLEDYEDERNLIGKDKNGSYLRSAEKDFKYLLHIYEISKIIKDSKTYEDVRLQVNSIEG